MKQSPGCQAGYDAAAQLEGASVVIQALAGADGRLFGSITTRQVAEAVTAQTGVAVTKTEILLPVPTIRDLGTYECTAVFGCASASFTLNVVS